MSGAQAVLDTNVLVSGLINPYGSPGKLIDVLLSQRLEIAFDDRLLLEYRAVLGRPHFRFSAQSLDAVFAIMLYQHRVCPLPWPHTPSPDPHDTPFLEVAAAARVPLVSGNARHFPPECRGGVRLMTPGEFLEAGLV